MLPLYSLIYYRLIYSPLLVLYFYSTYFPLTISYIIISFVSFHTCPRCSSRQISYYLNGLYLPTFSYINCLLFKYYLHAPIYLFLNLLDTYKLLYSTSHPLLVLNFILDKIPRVLYFSIFLFLFYLNFLSSLQLQTNYNLQIFQ